MRRRTVIQRILGSLLVAGACHDSTAPPALPTCHSSSASQLTLAVAAYTAIDPATDVGCVTIAANTSTLQAEYLIVSQSAAGTWGLSSTFTLGNATLAPTAMPAAQRLAPPASSSPRGAATDFDAFLRRRGAARAARAATLAPSAPAPAASPLPVTPPTVGSLRQFAVCADLNCSHFQKVGARAKAVGAHVAIYVDTLAPANGLDSADIDTLKQVFDARLYPLDTSTFGGVTDLDTNGVVIALMTPVVNALVTKTACASTGYIAGFFFPDDLILSVPIDSSNHGEIFYSIVADSAGTVSCAHTRANVKHVTPGTFMHEFQHMINFAQHVLIKFGNATEDGWLDEGLSKYAEELAGRSFLRPTCQNYPTYTPCPDTLTFWRYTINNVYDAYQYLHAPGGSALLIQLDQGTLAEVGASWLFMRYLVDQFGTQLTDSLAQTTLAGSANVAAQTHQPFTTTVTRWALSNWVSDLPGFATPPELRDTSWHFRTRTFPFWNQQDPTDFPLPFPLVPAQSASGIVSLSATLQSGSGVYLRVLQDPGAPAFTLQFTGPSATFSTVVPRLNIIRIH
ncbi:MAG TPA: hypothetical protein VM736_13080 [Gemmatimonadales bacterium]|nr:hypothetical protein [Gemmatimonadales bacterium]